LYNGFGTGKQEGCKMEIKEFDTSKIDLKTGLLLGKNNAPVKVVEFINLRCPHCKEWWNQADDLLTSYVKEGKVQRILKHYNKDKESLEHGNIIHDYLNYSDSKKTKQVIDVLFERQEEWGTLPKEEVGTWAENELGLKKEPNEEIVREIIDETQQAKVGFIPTIFIDSHVFDEHISEEELIDIIEAAAK